jgi:hypothetical protein
MELVDIMENGTLWKLWKMELVEIMENRTCGNYGKWNL